jgi:nicotinate-nucleotide adenylyltransferase
MTSATAPSKPDGDPRMSTQPALPRRIGVFGGAFDPPHHGHTALAQAALQHLDLDLLLVVPTGTAWHKSRPLSDAQHRLAMSALAFGDIPQTRVDGCEIARSGPSYTVDTLRDLRQAYPDAGFFLLMGQDQAQHLGSWSRAEDLPQLATLCVAGRTDAAALLQPAHLSFSGAPSLQLTMPAVPCSSTAILEGLAAGRDTGTMLAPAVARYIAQHRLYATISPTENPD